MVLQWILHLIYRAVNKENSFATDYQMKSSLKTVIYANILLLLDEVLMLDNKMCEYLFLCWQDIKAMPKVFGGIYIILSGFLL